jgi:predicted transcriptional regulator
MTTLDYNAATAATCSGLSHPVRVAILRELRSNPTLLTSELRQRVSTAYKEIDARGLIFHLKKMEHAGLVRITRAGRRDTAELALDVTITTRPT